MQKIIFYAVAMLCLFTAKIFAQESFETQAKKIAKQIQVITKQEKDSLKMEIEKVNDDLDDNKITSEQADERKMQLADKRAKNIETRVALEEAKLTELVKKQVDGTLPSQKSVKLSYQWDNWENDKKVRDSVRKTISEFRTTSQFVIAFGLNNVVEDGDLGSIEGNDFKVWGSRFVETGITFNTRIFKNHNLLHAKYGVSLMKNTLRPTENRVFVNQGDQTTLENYPVNLKDSKLRNIYVVVPVHLEFDFTKKQNTGERTYFRTHENFRIGIGGYAGGNIKSKSVIRYEENGNKVRERSRGDYNVNDFIYGLSAYIGYGEIALYAKYDLNPIFENNTVDQNNVSLGIRFDLN